MTGERADESGGLQATTGRRNFKALLRAGTAARTAYPDRVSGVGGNLNSAWFLIAPARDFLTDAITAN